MSVGSDTAGRSYQDVLLCTGRGAGTREGRQGLTINGARAANLSNRVLLPASVLILIFSSDKLLNYFSPGSVKNQWRNCKSGSTFIH